MAIMLHTSLLSHNKSPQAKLLHRDSPITFRVREYAMVRVTKKIIIRGGTGTVCADSNWRYQGSNQSTVHV